MTKARLLVVEDEAIVARDLQRTLQRMGYEVTALAASGEEALAHAAAQRPDLALRDIHLAGELDGVATAQQMRQAYGVPVVFLTAHSDEATFQRAQITEPYGYVLKPFEERELEIAVSIALYRHRVESQLSQMERWLATTLRSIADAFIATDLSGGVTFMNQQAESMTGWTLPAALGQPVAKVLRLVQAADHALPVDLLARLLREDAVLALEPNTLLLSRDGLERPVENSAAPIRDPAGNLNGFVIVFRDITARMQAEEQLRFSAVHDPLTGLANRALLMDRLEHAFEHARRHPEHQFAVLYLDLDGFKSINDSLGHLTGDQVLVGVARRLEASLRAEDTVARVGGDEFVILLESISDLRGAAHVAARIQESIAGPMPVEGRAVEVGISIGIAMHGHADQGAADILREADAALYRAKAVRKGRLVIAGADQHEVALKLLELEVELRQAASAGEFKVWYQPLVAFTHGQLWGREALLRWQHPSRGLLLPAEFLPLMEDTGQLLAVGDWVLFQACRAASGLGQSMTVNLSPRQFRQAGLTAQVARALEESGLPPGRLCLDIPETALTAHDQALETLRALHGLGVQLHLDDFGSGLTSLSLLHQAPFDALKLGQGAVEAGLAGTTLLLARALGLRVIAKGLETTAQAEWMHELGCEQGQGYLYGKPKDGV